MSYVKNTWTEGDVITAEKLNNIENGVSEVGEVYELELTEEEISQVNNDEGFIKLLTEEEYQRIIKNNLLKITVSNNSFYVLYKNMVSAENYIFVNIISATLPTINPSQPIQYLLCVVRKISNDYQLKLNIISLERINSN